MRDAQASRPGVGMALAAGTVLALSACTQTAAVSSTARSLPGTPPGPAAAMARYLSRLTAAGHFSGTVLVARRGHIVLRAGYGLADRATGTSNSPGTLFQIGSVTKQFTAMAIAMLAELLTHTSGIADWATWRLTGPLPGEATDPISAIVRRAEAAPLAFRPGSRASYSNPGYVVLGAIIQRISGMSYAAFLHTRIFAPLGMERTGVFTGGAAGPGHAVGYLADGAVAPTLLTAAASAAGAIYSDTGDLYRWDQALITGTPHLVTASMMGRILTVHAACPRGSCPLPGDRGYGYGWFIGTGPAGVFVHHSGPVLGFWAYNGIYPRSQTVVVILSNLDTVQINPISQRLNTLATGSTS